MKKITTAKHVKGTKRKIQPLVGEIGGADYGRLLADIKERVRSAQYEALRAVNKELVALYWDIGRMITEHQTSGTHGDAVVKQLAIDLQAEFPGISGFSWRDLFNMSEFFSAYCDKPKLQPLAAIIGWTHKPERIGESGETGNRGTQSGGRNTELLSRLRPTGPGFD